MTRDEFLARWEQLPGLKNAELIEGVVYVASPVSRSHATLDSQVQHWLRHYAYYTTGCEAGVNATWLTLDSAPQIDAYLRIRPIYGGQSKDHQTYPLGAPELAVEICVTSTDYDFGPKLALYQRAGVREYITLETFRDRITWRVLDNASYAELRPGHDGIYRSGVFPGLWLDPQALFGEDGPALLAALQRGLDSPEHLAFAAPLRPR